MSFNRLVGSGMENIANSFDIRSADGEDGDFGRVIRNSPSLRVSVRNEGDVFDVFSSAVAAGQKVTIQGTGHSCGGQSLSSNGIQVINRIDGAGVEWISSEEIEIPSGLKWKEVERILMRRGLSVPITPDALELSVGGTLSVGGYGMDSILLGGQIDHVTGLALCAPDGNKYWCTPNENVDLFRFALAGLGQLGMVTSVRMRVVPLHRGIIRWRYQCSSLVETVASMRWLDDALVVPPLFRAIAQPPGFPGRCEIIYGFPSEVDGSLDDHRWLSESVGLPDVIDEIEGPRFIDDQDVTRWVSSFGPTWRLWADYGFAYPDFLTFCTEIERLWTQGEFGEALSCVYPSVLAPSKHGRDFFPFDLRSRSSSRTFTCGLYCMIPFGNTKALAKTLQVLERCAAFAKSLGGRPYVYGWYRIDGNPALFDFFPNDVIRTLGRLRRRVDPHDVLKCG
ncbi:FAD-binding oxidoreductase [Burkholderia metallica]|uniref:FAD-binding oxidoreductase n=1 Tax=Burkholderia metallica TaxID=488729 RepID=UPI001CF58A41|nr:FAD-binding protein [Burkholderia metallica]MCA8003434.1 FAD-binding protein [Burkholderia metallica]